MAFAAHDSQLSRFHSSSCCEVQTKAQTQLHSALSFLEFLKEVEGEVRRGRGRGGICGPVPQLTGQDIGVSTSQWPFSQHLLWLSSKECALYHCMSRWPAWSTMCVCHKQDLPSPRWNHPKAGECVPHSLLSSLHRTGRTCDI